MALLLPFTYGMDPTTAIVLLASTYVGAEYGGSIPAILIRTPGTNAAAATVIDGYAMKEQGKAGEALGISLYSGFVGGMFGLAVLVLLAEPLSSVALAFTPTAYFALGVLGLSVIGSVSGDSLVKGLMAALLGLMISSIGTDPVTGVSRFTFGSPGSALRNSSDPGDGGAVRDRRAAGAERGARMGEGVERGRADPVSVAGDVAAHRASAADRLGDGHVRRHHAGRRRHDLGISRVQRSAPVVARTRKSSARARPEGIAAPEAANNTVACTALVPMLSLGIPSSNSSAVLLGGFLIHGLIPGPMLFVKNPDVVNGLFTGLFIANIAMLILGYLIMAPCLWLVNRPKPYLMGFIYAFVVSGVYAIEASLFHVGVALLFGVIGYAMRYFKVPVPADGARGRSRLHGGVELSTRAGALGRRPHDLPSRSDFRRPPGLRGGLHRRIAAASSMRRAPDRRGAPPHDCAETVAAWLASVRRR